MRDYLNLFYHKLYSTWTPENERDKNALYIPTASMKLKDTL